MKRRVARAGIVAAGILVAVLTAAVALTLVSIRDVQPGTAQSRVEESLQATPSASPSDDAHPMEAAAWCAADGSADNRSLVKAAAVEFLGLDPATVADDTPMPEGDPFWSLACRVAYELWGLTDDEWHWCFDAGNRDAFLIPAIRLLELGEEEAAGTDSFAEAPGDDPAEYTLACRLAYRYLRHAGVDATPPDAVDELAHLDPADSDWCETHPGAVVTVGRHIEVDATPDADTPAERLAYVRACRLAALLAAEPPPPEIAMPPAAPEGDTITLYVLIQNASDVQFRLFESTGDGFENHTDVLSCSEVYVSGEGKEPPLVIEYADPNDPGTRHVAYSSDVTPPEPGGVVRMHITVSNAREVAIVVGQPVPPMSAPCE